LLITAPIIPLMLFFIVLWVFEPSSILLLFALFSRLTFVLWLFRVPRRSVLGLIRYTVEPLTVA
jgi:hypothetical protein